VSLQQVNLYLPELRPKKEWLTLGTLLLTITGFTLIMLFSLLKIQRDIHRNQQHITFLQGQKTDTEQRINEVLARPRPGDSAQLERQKRQLQVAVSAREHLAQIIAGQNLGNDAGFSAIFGALSKHAKPPIAVEHFRILRGGSYMEMKGETGKPEDIPLFLQQLNSEVAFVDVQFGRLALAEKTNRPGRYLFTLGFAQQYPLADKEPK
jgi:hypothetical protein